MTLVRLSKRMSEMGLCSRRDADRFIERGWVRVDGQAISELGYKVTEDQQIELSPQAKREISDEVTILVHKPVGYVSGQAEDGYEPAVVLLSAMNQIRLDGESSLRPEMHKQLAVVGRLDIDSKGLLIFTQDGRLAKKLIGPNSNVEKEYRVYFEGNMTSEIQGKLTLGLQLDGKKLKRADIKLLKPNLANVILREGRKRQIRRMFDLVGLRVTGLKRIRVGKIQLGDLPEGKWRFLRKDESF